MLTLECSGEEVVRWITETLVGAGLQVTPSFDLRMARAAHTECSCPHHGTADCDCQLTVLLVYGTDDAWPATLVAHGRDGHTYLSFTSTPEQLPSPMLAATISASLSLDAFSTYEQMQAFHQVP